ncbi:ATP-grasp domain-containing protein [Candidatus Gracilibacteria bacterium]|nr:ATP-grasp domain-containing protein [Candidatus Gracilibacteria bacterium]
MHRKAIVHVVTKSRMKSDAFSIEIDLIEHLSEKYGIKNVIFYKGEGIEYQDMLSKLEKFGILLYNYTNRDDLKEKIQEVNNEYEIVFVDTPMELLVNVVNEVRTDLGLALSDSPDIFRDKYLQRRLIQEHDNKLGIRFISLTPDKIDLDSIESKVGYPCIIKPTDGLQSSGVVKIHNRDELQSYLDHYQDFHDRLKSRGVDSKNLIIEEFIDGQLYSVDYFVNHEGEVMLSPAVKVGLARDIGVKDYANISRVLTEKTVDDLKGKRLKHFVKSTIQATGIRNTFVHHEFKLNSKGELKTIELNGRIGGGRLELLYRAYGINLYEFIINKSIKVPKIKKSNIAVNIYATCRGELDSFNQELLHKIHKRKSVFSIFLEEKCVGKEVGLTQDGFVKLGTIKLEHENYDEIRKDYRYIKKHYRDLLEIDTQQGGIKIFKSLKKIFKK